LDPNFAKPHNNLGNALLREGDRAGAIKEFRAALGLDPFYKIAHYNLANTLGDVKEADGHYRAACPTFSNRFCLARNRSDCESSGWTWQEFGVCASPEYHEFMVNCQGSHLFDALADGVFTGCIDSWKKHVEQGQ
jgi:tetratricopeptide (TPR) repeat protein